MTLAPTPILPTPSSGDVSLSLAFNVFDPVELLVVETPHALTVSEYLGLVETAAARLALYAYHFRQAMEADVDPVERLRALYQQARADGDERGMDRLADEIGIAQAEQAGAGGEGVQA